MEAHITIDITESGTTIAGMRMVGIVPETHESNDFSLFVASRNSMVYITNSIDDEIMASGKGFKSAVTNLANLYGIPVVVESPASWVKANAKIRALVGTYEPTITGSRFIRTMDGKEVRVGDTCEYTNTKDETSTFVVTAVTGHGVVVRFTDVPRSCTYAWNMFQGLMAEGRIVRTVCGAGDCGKCRGCEGTPVVKTVPALPVIEEAMIIWDPAMARTLHVWSITDGEAVILYPNGSEAVVSVDHLRREVANGNMEIMTAEEVERANQDVMTDAELDAARGYADPAPECVCDVIVDAGPDSLPAGGRVCPGCGSVFTKSDPVLTPEEAVLIDVMSEREARAILDLIIMDGELMSFTSTDVKTTKRVPRKLKKSSKIKSTSGTRRQRRG